MIALLESGYRQSGSAGVRDFCIALGRTFKG
jgi:hypothetical protein